MIIRHKPFKHFGVNPVEVTVNDKEGLAFTNPHGSQILTKEEFEEMIALANVFYESEGVEDYIRTSNRFNEFAGHHIFDTATVDGKRIVPRSMHRRKPYKKNMKKDWVFYCNWCKTKVSSADPDRDSYVMINEQVSLNFDIYGQFCCEACAENYWYEQILDYMNENGYSDVFHMDKTVGRS